MLQLKMYPVLLQNCCLFPLALCLSAILLSTRMTNPLLILAELFMEWSSRTKRIYLDWEQNLLDLSEQGPTPPYKKMSLVTEIFITKEEIYLCLILI